MTKNVLPSIETKERKKYYDVKKHETFFKMDD